MTLVLYLAITLETKLRQVGLFLFIFTAGFYFLWVVDKQNKKEEGKQRFGTILDIYNHNSGS